MNPPPLPWRLQVQLQPRARQNRIVGRQGDVLKVQVHAPPVEGAANAALIEVLAAALEVPKRAVRVIRGATSRAKLVEIDVDASTGAARLEKVLAARVDKQKGRE